MLAAYAYVSPKSQAVKKPLYSLCQGSAHNLKISVCGDCTNTYRIYNTDMGADTGGGGDAGTRPPVRK